MNKRIAHIILSISVALSIQSCAVALIAGGAHKSAKTKEQRQRFMSQLQQTNTEREQKGLKLLDWCSEV